jgi:cytochrome c peroxidase
MNRICRFSLVTAIGLVLPATAAAQSPSPSELARMKAEYRRPAALPVGNRALADLGRLLFWDPRVFGVGYHGLRGCHLPDRGWSVAEAQEPQ